MKIVLIGPTYPYAGGISHFNTILAKELEKRNEVKVFSYYKRYPHFLYPAKEQEDKKSTMKIEVHAERTLSMINPFSWINTALKIRRFNPEKIVFHFVTPFTSIMFSIMSFISKFKRKTKTVLICHNLKPHEKSFFDKILTKIIFSNTNEFITHSNEDFNELKKKFKNRKVVKGFAPALNFFNFKTFSKNESKKILKLNKKTILFFGYVRKYKGLDLLLDSLPFVLKQIDLELVIAGQFCKNKKVYLEKIKELEIEKNVKIFDEYLPNEKVGLFFSASDVILMPYKSLSNSAILQIALSFNKPVIGTKVGALKEVIKNNINGLFTENSKESIAKAIIKFYEEKKEKEFSENMKKIKENFSWEKYTGLLANE